MNVMTVLALVLGVVLGLAAGAAVTQASLWWRRYEVRRAEVALQRRRAAFEACRVQWERRESVRELDRV